MLYLTIPSRHAPQSFCGTLLQHAANQIHCVLAQFVCIVGKPPLSANDIFEKTLLVDAAFVEGRAAEEHFKDEAAYGPVVDGSVMSSAENNLRCKVERCSAKCVSFICYNFGKSKINNDWVPIPVQKYILRLQIPVHDVSPVHVRQPLQNPRGVKLGRNLRQSPVHLSPLDKIQQLPPLNQRQQHVDARVVLKGVDQLANERMIQLGHDGAFPLCGRGLALIEQFPFGLDLERVRRLPSRTADDPNAPEGPRPEQLVKVQVAERFGTGFRLHRGIFLRPEFVALFAVSSVAPQPMQVLNHRVDAAQGELSAFHRVAHDLDGLLAILRPPFGTAEFHVLVGSQALLPEVIPRLQNAFAIRVLLAELIHDSSPHDHERGLLDHLLLLVNDLASPVSFFVDEGGQQLVLKVLEVRIAKKGDGL
mmetsp:Transcript_915/g.2071  ORF Transcript_915/g.2071 Transcript_915/m.2071 type:complete len:420 (-) Transcript_915:1556-2815(-)